MRGYRKKPFWIYVIGVGYFALPLFTLVQFLVKLNYSFSLLGEVIFSDFFLLEVLCSVTAGVSVLVVSRFSFLIFIMLGTYATSVKVYNLRYHALFEYPADLLVIVFCFSVTALFLVTRLRIPYLNPSSRWWTQPPRYSLVSRGALLFKQMKFPVITLDFSLGGVFVKLDERLLSISGEGRGVERGKAEERRRSEPIGNPLLTEGEIETARAHVELYPRSLGERPTIQIQTLPEADELFPGGVFESVVEVVWALATRGWYRYGLGLKFTGLEAEGKRRLKEYLRLLKRKGFKERIRE